MVPNDTRQHLVVVNWKDITHPAAGGAEVFCDQVARELVRLGYEITMLTSRGRDTDSGRGEIAGYRVRRLGRTYSVYPLALLWLFKHRRHVDGIIDSQNGIPFFTPLVMSRRTPIAMLIHHVHQEQFTMYFPPPMAKFGRWLERTASRTVYGSRAICTVSPSSRAEIRRSLGLRGPIYLVPNGSATVDAGLVRVRSATPTITCVGRMVAHKRWHLLIEAVAELRTEFADLVVNIVGTGPEIDALRAHAVERGVADMVTFHGFVSAEQRDELMRSAWVTASTSIGEGWGLSMIEAAAAGIPAVAIDVPGLRDSVRENVTGWLAKENELSATVAVALRELSDESTAAGYDERCRSWAGSLRWSATAQRFESVLMSEAAVPGLTAERRRSRSDIATVVELPAKVATTLTLEHVIRTTDQATFCAACVHEPHGPSRVLLYGADERGAVQALRRAGVDPTAPGVTMRLCRPTDLLSWAGEGIGHSFGAAEAGFRCPWPEAREPLNRAEELSA